MQLQENLEKTPAVVRVWKWQKKFKEEGSLCRVKIWSTTSNGRDIRETIGVKPY